MILVNTDYISGEEFDTLTIVKGSAVRAKHIGKDILALVKLITGGELTAYSDMLREAREIATARMVEDAQLLNADAVINIRYSTSSITGGAAEILVYGTAVAFK